MLADKNERAARLRQAIKDRGFATFKEAAARHHYVEATLTSHANGTRGFDLETGYAYAKSFKVDPAWLLGLTTGRAKDVSIPSSAIRGMLEEAMRELPIGATVEDYLRSVPEGLHVRLARYLADAVSQGSVDEANALDKDAQPHAPTKSDAEA